MKLHNEEDDNDILLPNEVQVYQQGPNTIHFYDEVNRKSIHTLKKIINGMMANRFVSEINIIINSFGGMGLGFYDYLKACPIPIITYVEGYCCSAATLLFLAGKERFISPTSLFMIHSFQGYPAAQFNEGESNDFNDSIKKHNLSIIENVYKKETKIPKALLKDIPYKEIWLTPEECVEYKIANGIDTLFSIS